jgi:excisionase family DNA binding protein
MTTLTDCRPLLLTRDEACRLLGIRLSHYKALVASGALNEIRIGERGKRLPYSEAQRFIEERLNEKTGSA